MKSHKSAATMPTRVKEDIATHAKKFQLETAQRLRTNP